MKFVQKYVPIFLLMLPMIATKSYAFQSNIPSSTGLIGIKEDSSEIGELLKLASYYTFQRADSGIYYGNKARMLARQLKSPEDELSALYFIVQSYQTIGQDAKSLQIALEGIKLADQYNLETKKGPLLSQIGHIYYHVSKDYTEALRYYQDSKSSYDADKNDFAAAYEQNYIGRTWLKLNQLDSAHYYCQQAFLDVERLKRHAAIVSLGYLGDVELAMGDTSLASTYFNKAVKRIEPNTPNFIRYDVFFSLAQFYEHINKTDSSVFFATEALKVATEGNLLYRVIKICTLLTEIYEPVNDKKALQYSRLASAYKDSALIVSNSATVQNLISFDEQQKINEIETAATAYKNQVKQFALIAGLSVFLLIAFIFFRNNEKTKKTNLILQSTLSDLKSTQSQLIQSEKMASLGELTAGIAHEIQNPLNFVNNFSEVSAEMIDEMKEELAKKDIDEASAIADDIKQNLEKINHHGKRADAIVKGMLQHSRSSTGTKEPTDINALVDEYLRLAYHGIRAKDKSFNASMETDFDASIGSVNIISQDIGRVVLNLINNAFYAVHEHTKVGKEGYAPTISISTKKSANQVLISVKDNGPGIPDTIKDKIFQPFFTTKPTGQGTGLGLSLSYDIVKAHGGELKVETKEGEGTEFVIKLAIKS